MYTILEYIYRGTRYLRFEIVPDNTLFLKPLSLLKYWLDKIHYLVNTYITSGPSPPTISSVYSCPHSFFKVIYYISNTRIHYYYYYKDIIQLYIYLYIFIFIFIYLVNYSSLQSYAFSFMFMCFTAIVFHLFFFRWVFCI